MTGRARTHPESLQASGHRPWMGIRSGIRSGICSGIHSSSHHLSPVTSDLVVMVRLVSAPLLAHDVLVPAFSCEPPFTAILSVAPPTTVLRREDGQLRSVGLMGESQS